MTIGTVHSTHEALATFAGEEAMLQRGEVLSLCHHGRAQYRSRGANAPRLAGW